MLRRVPVSDIKNGRLSRSEAYLAIVMRFYPRYLKKELTHAYDRALAPSEELFAEFKAQDREGGDHDAAFAAVDYESRFDLSPGGRDRLRELAAMARTREVALICQCGRRDRCHADLLLMWAREKFGAPVYGLKLDYPTFAERLQNGDLQ